MKKKLIPRQLGKLLCTTTDISVDETSSPSVDSSDEESRLVINGEKVFRLWQQQGQHIARIRGPRNSTPIRRRNHGNPTNTPKTGSLPNLSDEQTFNTDWGNGSSIWLRTLSESDISSIPHVHHDMVEPETASGRGKAEKSWKPTMDPRRKPFQLMSHAKHDLELSAPGCPSMLPMYRVNASRYFQESTSDVEDVSDSGNTSMEEFMSKVDQEKLASLLEFCDRVSTQCIKVNAARNISFLAAVDY